MKRKLLTSLLIFSAFYAKNNSVAQVLFEHDFETGVIAPMTVFDNDNRTVNSGVSWVTDAWVTNTFVDGNQASFSTSWYTPTGQADDWLITPPITITDPNTVVRWRGLALDGTYSDGYNVKVSTTNDSIHNFTNTLFSTSAENNSWTPREEDLAAYVGQTIYIAFQNNSNDMYLLSIDDIWVGVPAQYDLEGVAMDMGTLYGLNHAPIAIEGSLFNFGSTAITSFDLNYSVNGGTPVTQSITASIPVFGTYNFSHPTSWTPATAGIYEIKAWASNLNGNPDGAPQNDTITHTVEILTQAADKKSLVEVFTSATCAPCKPFNDDFNPASAARNANTPGADMMVVKYQMNWPGAGNDASYNGDGAARRSYRGVNAIPDPFVNGEDVSASTTTVENQVDADNKNSSPIGISGSLSFPGVSATELTVDVNVTVEPYDNLGNAHKLYIAVLNKSYNYSLTNGETEFHHVMRKMLPNGNGITLATLATGTPQSFNETYTFDISTLPTQMSYDLWEGSDIEVVAFVQDPSGTILQAELIGSGISGVDENEEKLGLTVFPNPARDKIYTKFEIEGTETVNIQLIDVLGKVVYNQQKSINSFETLEIDIADFPKGMYTLTIVNSQGNFTTKKIIKQ